MIADLLGYVLTDSVRDRGFQDYVRRYTLRHPQPADVEHSFEQTSGLELDWFFDQLTRTERSMDYAVEDLDIRGDSSVIHLERRDKMFFPIDVQLTMEDGTVQMVTIPTSEMFGAKPVGAGWTVAPAWGFTFPKYTLRVPGRVARVQLDPDRRTPDRNRLNDSDRFPLSSTFLHAPVANEAFYSLGWRPLLNYADDYGVGIGVRAQGTYWLNRLNFKGALTLWPEVLVSNGRKPNVDGTYCPFVGPCVDGTPADRSWLEGIDYAYRFETGVPHMPVTRWKFRADKHLGVLEETLGLRHAFGRQAVMGRDKGVLSLWLQHQRQPWDRGFGFDDLSGSDARGYGDEIPVFFSQQVFGAGLRYEIGRGMDRVRLTAETGATVSDKFQTRVQRGSDSFVVPTAATAHRITLEAQKTFKLGPLASVARTMLGLGDNNLLYHKRYRLGQSTFEDTWRNAATRTAYGVDERVIQAPFGAFSGVGPVGYFHAPQRSTAASGVPAYIGGSPTSAKMWAGSVEVGLPQPLEAKVLAPLALSAFSGAAILWGESGDGYFMHRKFDPGDMIADAGVQATYDVAKLAALSRWTAQSDVLQSR